MNLEKAYEKLYKAHNKGEFIIEDILCSKNKNITFVDAFDTGLRYKKGVLCFGHNLDRIYLENQCWFCTDLFQKTFTTHNDKKAIKVDRSFLTKELDYDNLSISQIMRNKDLRDKVFLSEGKYYKIIDCALGMGDSIDTIDKWNMPDVCIKIFKQKFKVIK